MKQPLDESTSTKFFSNKKPISTIGSAFQKHFCKTKAIVELRYDLVKNEEKKENEAAMNVF